MGKRGGSREGSGRKQSVKGGREWVRGIVDDPDRRTRFLNALDAALVGWARSKNPSEAAASAVTAYLRAFEHGYGRPPQALDVSLSSQDALRFIAEYPTAAGGDVGPAAAAELPAPARPREGA